VKGKRALLIAAQANLDFAKLSALHNRNDKPGMRSMPVAEHHGLYVSCILMDCARHDIRLSAPCRLLAEPKMQSKREVCQ
jgi:hypothetical protein